MTDKDTSTESRVTALESTIAFQEQTIVDLSDVICEQRKEIDLLNSQVRDIAERITRNAETAHTDGELPAQEKPPHY